MMKIRVRDAVVFSISESGFPLLYKLGNNLIVNKYLLSTLKKYIYFLTVLVSGSQLGHTGSSVFVWNIGSSSLSRD